ncbi:MAG: collagen-like protein [Verrucomicrobiaceae bacterium]|nr:MAG: collagen-like protein [Verrucomicrobiaceae bacterium]
MANKKISQLNVGGKLLPNDLVPVARGGTNVSVLGSELLGTILPSNGTTGQILRIGTNGALTWSKEADQVTGLPYLFTGPGKYQYWRVGVKSEVSNTTALWEIILSRGTTGAMPTIANRTQNWPIEWTDGNPETGTGTATFGSFATETIDFGTAVQIDTIRLNGLSSVSQLKVEYSSDKNTWYVAYNGPTNLVEHVEKAFALTIQYDTYLTTYNLTADPTKNVGRVLKANADGTGFDFIDLGAGPQGEKGEKGDTGATGPQGPAGPAGTSTGGTGLSFTPVQQGGGINQLDNKVYIGWDGSKLRATVDGSDLGQFAFGSTGGGGGGSGGRPTISYASNVLYSISGETDAYTITVTPTAGALLDIDLGSINPVLVSGGLMGSRTQIETRVYRNGVQVTSIDSKGRVMSGLSINGQFSETATGEQITYRMTKMVVVYDNQSNFSSVSALTNTNNVYGGKIVAYA